MIIKPRLFRKPRKGHWATKGLKFLMLGNEGSGDKVFDLSGNGNDGTFQGNTSWVPGKSGSVLDFDGNDSINLTKNASPAALPITVIARIKIDSTGSAHRIIDAEGDTNYNGFWFQIDGDKVNVGYGDGTGGFGADRRSGSGNTSLSANIWYDIAAVVRGATDMSIYLNGMDDGINYSGEGGTYVQGSTPGFIGKLYLVGTSYYLTGNIGYIMIYNRALSASEIAELYWNPFAMFDRDSIELWVGATSVGVAPSANPKGPLGHPLCGALAGPISF